MEFLDEIFIYEDFKTISGLTEELDVLYIYNYYKKYKKNVLVVTSSLYEANKVYQLLTTYTSKTLLFPMDDFLTSVALAASPDLKLKRIETLEKIKSNDHFIVVTHLTGYLKYLTLYENFKKSNFEIKVGDTVSREDLINKLEEYGYVKTSIVNTTGEYSVRGYIIDIFLFNENNPIRMEMFGSDIESLRFFDVDTQRSIENIDSFTLTTANEKIGEVYSSLYDYLEKPMVFYYDYNLIISAYKKMQKEIFDYNVSKGVQSDFKYMFDFDQIEVLNYIYIDKNVDTISSSSLNFKSGTIENFNSDFEKLKEFVINKSKNNKVIFCLSNKAEKNNIENLIKEINDIAFRDNICILDYKINNGFQINNYVVIGEYDIENVKRSIKYKNNYKFGKKIKNYNDLSVGDYVVHNSHGVGIYGGLVTLTKSGLQKDYILINYAKNDKIYVPVEKIDLIYKYSDKDGIKPKIDKLNSTSWAKTKLRVRNRIKDISEELIKLYANRLAIKGKKYSDFPDEKTFELDFPYDETSDQIKCINDIYEDLRKEKPMERLLCGDVGFGKTEVAFRAIFKAIINGDQVAYLCPTTLLSRQQYNNAMERFRHFPVNIALLNRFTSQKDFKKIIGGLKDGTIDVVFGTHKLFNKEIVYKNLGLLIIDEEQRFGVTHKEKIKELKNTINVLTLSATPIPRTLKMAMSGLKDMSVIDTAPVNRYPVQTYVIEENEVIMKDAIYKELARNGQVYILYNKVNDIDLFASKISQLIPEASVIFAHGRMDKGELESIVERFINNEFNILVCTTIIETGIDIPNVNTLIIVDADNFGLSQLYQIRGRVGRSDRIAYAYLMYKPSKVLTETAIKRLKSIKDFTELGSGYKIAMRDMAIRGAGELLGSEQAGFVDSIGIELYMKMLEEEVKKLKGEKIEEETDDNNLIEVDTHVATSMSSDENLIIEIHKLINSVVDEKSFNEIKSELEDRFGKLDEKIIIYMYEEWFDHLAKKIEVSNVKQTGNFVEIEIPSDISSKVHGDKLFLELYQINRNFKIRYFNKKIYISLKTTNLENHFLVYLIKLIEMLISNIGNV